MSKNETKYVVYYRVSTAKQGASGLGLEAQKQSVKAFTRNCANCIIGEFTEIETGTNKRARPIFQQAKELALKEGATLLIAKIDRLARNVHFISGLREQGLNFIAVDMPTASQLTIDVMAAFAEHEAKLISKRTKEGLRAKITRYIESIAPSMAKVLGAIKPTESMENLKACIESASMTPEDYHKFTPTEKKVFRKACKACGNEWVIGNDNFGNKRGRKKSIHSIDRDERNRKKMNEKKKVLAFVKSLHKQELTLAQIATELNSNGYSTPRGAEFKPTQVHRILEELGLTRSAKMKRMAR